MSEIAHHRVERVEDEHEGSAISSKSRCCPLNPTARSVCRRKALLPRPEGMGPERRASDSRGDRLIVRVEATVTAGDPIAAGGAVS